MKLVKLSLAAIVAVGAMTTFASAKPLEEAIKGVEVSGFARYRFQSNSDKTYDDKGSTARNRFQGLLNITSPIADNLKFGISLAHNHSDLRGAGSAGQGGIAVDKFWFQYAINDFTVKAGKIDIATPWTDSGFDGSRGNGILATFTGIEGFTFAGAYFNQTNLEPKVMDVDSTTGKVSYDDVEVGEEDLYAAGVIGNVGPVGLQVWAARMEHIVDYAVFAQVDVDIDGFNAKAQVNMLKLDDQSDKGFFYGATVGYEDDQFSFNLGYTKNDKKQPIYAFVDGSDGFIEFGQQLGEKITYNKAGMRTIFAEAGFSYEKFGFEAGYGFAKAKGSTNNNKYNEIYGLVSYDYAKNFDLQLYYSILDDKDNAADNNELRFQARYKF